MTRRFRFRLTWLLLVALLILQAHALLHRHAAETPDEPCAACRQVTHQAAVVAAAPSLPALPSAPAARRRETPRLPSFVRLTLPCLRGPPAPLAVL